MSVPQAIVSRGSREAGTKTVEGPDQMFSGGPAYIDPCLSTPGDDSGQNAHGGTVTFTPGSRTNWHWHEKGQLMKVESGSGWVCDKGAKAIRINAGDTIWCPSGTVHWHGADDDSIMIQYVFALGETEWYGPVSDEEYASKTGR